MMETDHAATANAKRCPVPTWLLALQAVAALLCLLVWLWCSSWRHAAVYEMADQMVRDGQISPAAAQTIRTSHGSLGAYLEQGWGSPAKLAGFALAGVAILGPLLTLACSRNAHPAPKNS